MAKSITLSADEHLVEMARLEAMTETMSFNQMFRRWLERFVEREQAASDYNHLMSHLDSVDSGGGFSRRALNER